MISIEPEDAEPTIPPKCPECGMAKNEWPGEGYSHEGQTFCCQGCAEGTGCTCKTVPDAGFSREGQEATRPEPRKGEQRAGAPAPEGELSGERDAVGTEEAIDQSGDLSAPYHKEPKQEKESRQPKDEERPTPAHR